MKSILWCVVCVFCSCIVSHSTLAYADGSLNKRDVNSKGSRNSLCEDLIVGHFPVAVRVIYKAVNDLGLVRASPSDGTLPGENDYTDHWTRDAAHTFEVSVQLLKGIWTKNPIFDPVAGKESEIWKAFQRMIYGNELIMNTHSPADGQSQFGAPKFEPDGKPFLLPWMRPQNDGSAARGLANISALKLLMEFKSVEAQKEIETLRSQIVRELEYMLIHWSKKTADAWEEIKGHQFYARYLTAMFFGEFLYLNKNTAGAKFDSGVVARVQSEFTQVAESLNEFWNPNLNHIVPTLSPELPSGVWAEKGNSPDILAILSVLEWKPESGLIHFSPTDPRVLKTALNIEASFAREYEINKYQKDHQGRALAPAIGRYRGDTYNGTPDRVPGHPGGPWFISTFGMSEYYFKIAEMFRAKGKIEITADLIPFFENADIQLPLGIYSKSSVEFDQILFLLASKGEKFFRRGLFHGGRHVADSQLKLSEQYDRYTGMMKGPQALTWSEVMYIRARISREIIRRNLGLEAGKRTE